MEYRFFFTGFPGFISNQLIRKVLKNNGDTGIVYVLVLPSMLKRAAEEREEIIRDLQLKEEQFQIIEGDITKPSLAIENKVIEPLFNTITHVFHLAAIYDLAVPRELAYLINVTGTNHVNEWVKNLKNLNRYVYFSTAYVAGLREGILYEHELIKPPAFKNYYEETKYEAEVLVERLKEKLPITIIRPGIVKGNSRTGETTKFDGPYFILNVLDRLRFLPVFPHLGKSEAVINLVPIDYILEATAYLSFFEGGVNKTYHLTDPNPYKVSEIYEMFMLALLNKKPIGRLPLSLAKLAFKIKSLRKSLGCEIEALDYFTWKGTFDCTQAQADLLHSHIRCPDFKEGIPAMVEFYSLNKDNPAYHIEIQ